MKYSIGQIIGLLSVLFAVSVYGQNPNLDRGGVCYRLHTGQIRQERPLTIIDFSARRGVRGVLGRFRFGLQVLLAGVADVGICRFNLCAHN